MHKISVRRHLFIFYCLAFIVMTIHAAEKPDRFIYVKTLIPSLKQDMRYFTANNFLGRPIHGYKKPVCILTSSAAHALLKVQMVLSKKNLGLLVFDCYRPQIAVDDFIQWSQNPNEQKMKNLYYPHIDKANLFRLNYIARRSGHTRGSTVDLTIIDLDTQQTLDMGTTYDFMDPLSHPANRDISPEQFKNRMLLRTLMLRFGFRPIETEWWHFTLRDEPYKNTYFNFLVE